MHTAKNDNGWVLCPSKSLPGKFYYFNVTNGETVWSLPDAKRPLFKDIQHITDKTHNFPEPKPVENEKQTEQNPHSITITAKKQPNVPTFGQISFPRYVSNTYPSTSNNCNSIFNTNPMPNMQIYGQTPKVVWAPIPLMMLRENEATFDQDPQTCEVDRVCVHSCEIPLSKRFLNYEKPGISFTKDNRLEKNVFTSTPLKSNPMFDPVGPVPTFSTFEPIPIFNQSQPVTQRNKKSLIKDPVLDIANLKISNEPAKYETRCNLFLQKNIEKSKLNIFGNEKKSFTDLDSEKQEKSMADLEKLDRNDLRLMLMARKRRYTEGDAIKPPEVKKIKLKYQDDQKLAAPKKRVTFLTNSPEINNANKKCPTPGALTIQSLRRLGGANRRDIWYIIVDTTILLENYEFLNDFVLSDGTCRLLIPETSHRDVKSLCSGNSFGRKHVFPARQVARALVDPPRHIKILKTDSKQGGPIGFYNDTNMAENDDILNCCLQTMDANYHVVLLTDDEDLLKKAKSLHIHAHKFKTLKELNTNNSQDLTPDVQSRMFQNFPGLPEKSISQPNQKSIFDDESITTEMTSEINRVIQGMTKKGLPSHRLETHNPTSNTFNHQNTFENQNERNKEIFNDKKSNFVYGNKGSNWPALDTHNPNLKNKEKMAELSVENNLKRFHIRHDAMEKRIKDRVEEWMCIYTQIMENALSSVLQNSSFRTDLMDLPWTLQEMIDQIKTLYEDHNILQIINKLTNTMSQCVSDRGKIKTDICPNDFIRTIGCGILLIQCLANLQPDCEELVNAMQSLTNLLRTLEDPEIDFDTIKVGENKADKEKRNHVKQPSEIIRYLQQHFEDWRQYDISDQDLTKNTLEPSDPKIFRVSGRNLNTLKLDSNKAITVTKSSNIESKIDLKSRILNSRVDDTVKTVENVLKPQLESNNNCDVKQKPPVKSIPNADTKITANELNFRLNENTFDIKSGPKVTRRVSIIKEYEDKVNKPVDMDALDYSDIYDYNSEINSRNLNDSSKVDYGKHDSGYNNSQNTDGINKILNEGKAIQETNSANKTDMKTKTDYNDSVMNPDYGIEKDTQASESNVMVDSKKTTLELNDSAMDNDYTVEKDHLSITDTTQDSGIESESQMVYCLVKSFLSELSGSFKAVHTFIDNNINQIREENLEEETKLRLHRKVNSLQLYLAEIINKLKRIVDRESTESAALSNILITLGEAASDKRINRYRSVIRKCLEQAQNLQNALKIMLSITNTDWDGSLSIHAESISSSIRYLNIFE